MLQWDSGQLYASDNSEVFSVFEKGRSIESRDQPEDICFSSLSSSLSTSRVTWHIDSVTYRS